MVYCIENEWTHIDDIVKMDEELVFYVLTSQIMSTTNNPEMKVAHHWLLEAKKENVWSYRNYQAIDSSYVSR